LHLQRLAAFVVSALLLFSTRAEAEVRLNKAAAFRVEVVSDGVSPWKLPFLDNLMLYRIAPFEGASFLEFCPN
jgi:hypothetical protein